MIEKGERARHAGQSRGLVLAGVFAAAGVAAALFLTRPGAMRGGSATVEGAAMANAQKQRTAGDRAGALATLEACASRDPRACRCADAAEELAVDLGHYDEAWTAVDKAQCDSPRHNGARAEALVATGRAADGLGEVAATLSHDASEPHAFYARAWALSAKGDSPEAVAAAERAVAGGRGLPALLLLGTMRFRAHDMGGARTLFDQAARLAPDDARVAYDQALVAQSEARYREAREGYLRALSLDPKMADARYNLAVLTHGAGADDEARHNLDELAAIAPDDPRIAPLRAMLVK
jgi:tetratricopeptide (TPR) repeat protein